MPLVPDPARVPIGTLRDMLKEMKEELTSLLEEVRHPHSRVLDPSSLATAEELLRSALAVLDRSEDRTAPELAADINLGYGVLVASIDLLKSHTDVPRVPRHRSDPQT